MNSASAVAAATSSYNQSQNPVLPFIHSRSPYYNHQQVRYPVSRETPSSYVTTTSNYMQPTSRNDSLLAMRKHRSLDGSQFLSQFDNTPTSTYSSMTPKLPTCQVAAGSYAPPPPPPPFFQQYTADAVPIDNCMISPQRYDFYGAGDNNATAATQHQNFSPYVVGNSYFGDKISHLTEQRPMGYDDSHTNYSGNDYNAQRTNSLLKAAGENFVYKHPSHYMGGNTAGYSTNNYVPPPSYSAPAAVIGNSGSVDAGSGSMQDYEMLKRECATIKQKLAYVMNSIRTFWSPELKKERQLRKEETLRISSLQYKLSQQSAEIQRVRNELEKREKDIGQLLTESDLGEMEAELRRLRAQIHTSSAVAVDQPRNFTDKTPTMHELQTARAKMERSELTLAEKTRELAACEVKMKCTEEQNAELEKRMEILTRSNEAYEAQLKLLHDDLDVLRKKLETKNQQIENRVKSIKEQEKELDAAKAQMQQQIHNIQENERQISQLTHRIDQLETLLRERDALVDRLKQRLAQSPDTRAEAELQQRLENVERDKNALQASIDELRRTSDAEKQNQLQIFQEETRQLRSTIANLQKELADRHVLIVSQNEKISQLDAELDTRSSYFSQRQNQQFNTASTENSTVGASNVASSTTDGSVTTFATISDKCSVASGAATTSASSAEQQSDVDEARNEIGRLLSIVRQLEKEKGVLAARLNNIKIGANGNVTPADKSITTNVDVNAILTKRLVNTESAHEIGLMSPSTGDKNENKALQLRIDALEEALRESVGITSERDRLIAEQKQLIQQLSNQVADLFKNSDSKDLQKLLQCAVKRAENFEKTLRNERLQSQRQIITLRKEVIMAVIREKDACIQLLHSPPEATRDKIDVLKNQREQLKHRLLVISDTSAMSGAFMSGTTSVQGNVGDTITTCDTTGSVPTKALSAMELNTLSSGAGAVSGMYGSMALTYGRQTHGYSVHRAPPPTLSTFQTDSIHNASGALPLPPINIAVPSYGATNRLGLSAPASLNYGKDNAYDDDGIWA